jgi:hypothetical protein
MIGGAAMADIPNFEPNWYLDDPNIIGQNADLFKTIEETIARLNLIKETGLVNLYRKGVVIEDPNATAYDIIEAINNIPISNGWPRQIPIMRSKVRIGSVSSLPKVWVTSLPMILTTYAQVKTNQVSGSEESQANPYYVNWNSAESGKDAEVTIKTKQGDSVFCFVWYSILSTDDSSIIPFSISDEWQLFKISESLVIDNLSYRVACYIKKDKGTGLEVTNIITNTGERRLNYCLIDFWEYSSIPDFIMEYSGTGTQTVSKEFDEPYLWIMRSFENDTYRYYIREDSIRKNYIYNENIKQNNMFLDRDFKGERKMSFDGSKTYSFFALRFV